MRLNLGCGAYPLPDWTNVDSFTEADVKGDIRELSFRDVTEVRMSHLLEHLPWRETVEILGRVRSWCRPGALLEVEVPNMEEIMARGTKHPLWFKYVYGDQSHGGEFHLAGFTAEMLADCLHASGWAINFVRKETSEHKGREGMPVLRAGASA